MLAWLGLGLAGPWLGQRAKAGRWLAGWAGLAKLRLRLGWAWTGFWACAGLAWVGLAWVGLAWVELAWLDLDWAGVPVLGLGGPELAEAWLGMEWASWGCLSSNLSASIRK